MKNKKLFILIFIGSLLCIGAIIITLAIVLILNFDSSNNLVKTMREYRASAKELNAQWDQAQTNCDKTLLLEEYANGHYKKDELGQLKQDNTQILNNEWNCFREMREKEIKWEKEQLSKLQQVNCNNAKSLRLVDDCAKFKKELNELNQVHIKLIPLLDQDYKDYIAQNECKIDNFYNHFEEDVTSVQKYAQQCEIDIPRSKENEIIELKKQEDQLIASTREISTKISQLKVK